MIGRAKVETNGKGLRPTTDLQRLTSTVQYSTVQAYLNSLNQCLQDRNLNVCLIYYNVHNFIRKCYLLQKHIMQKQYIHFSQHSTLIEQQGINQSDVPSTTFTLVFDAIKKKFTIGLENAKQLKINYN